MTPPNRMWPGIIRTPRSMWRNKAVPFREARAVRIVVPLLLVAIVAAACSHPAAPPASPFPIQSFNPAPSPSSQGSSLPTRPTGGKFPLGTFTLVSGSPSCPAGQSCSIEFKVSCPDVQRPASGTLQVMAPGGSPRGMVMVFIGGLGTGFAQTEGVNPQFLHDLVGQGFEVVVDLWTDSWLQSASGEQVGSARLGCRPATAIDWTYTNMYRKLGVGKKAVGVCGFCLTGNSGGSSQIAYALSLYGMGSIVNAAVMSGGPPHAAIAKGCLQQSGYAYDPRSSDILDYSWGF